MVKLRQLSTCTKSTTDMITENFALIRTINFSIHYQHLYLVKRCEYNGVNCNVYLKGGYYIQRANVNSEPSTAVKYLNGSIIQGYSIGMQPFFESTSRDNLLVTPSYVITSPVRGLFVDMEPYGSLYITKTLYQGYNLEALVPSKLHCLLHLNFHLAHIRMKMQLPMNQDRFVQMQKDVTYMLDYIDDRERCKKTLRQVLLMVGWDGRVIVDSNAEIRNQFGRDAFSLLYQLFYRGGR